MQKYPQLLTKSIPIFKVGTLSTTIYLNLRCWKSLTLTLSKNLALYNLINGVVAFKLATLYQGKKASSPLYDGWRNVIVSNTPSPRINRRITWTMHRTNCRPIDESTPGKLHEGEVQEGEKSEKGYQKCTSDIANFLTSRRYFSSRTVYFVRDYGMYLYYRQRCSLA